MNASKGRPVVDKRRILKMVLGLAVSALVLIGVSLIPVARKGLAEYENELIARKAQMAAAKYIKGLTPCAYSANELDDWLQKYLPGRPDVSINVFPSFFPHYAIRLVGQDLYYFKFDSSLYDTYGAPPPKFNPQHDPAIYHSHLSANIARELPQVLTNDIRQARAELGEGADGTTYDFHTQNNCAITWSPDSRTRAGYFVELSDLLTEHAKTNDPVNIAANEQKILAILKLLQSN